jgi:hypothetical protein
MIVTIAVQTKLGELYVAEVVGEEVGIVAGYIFYGTNF